jgi:uncharacterized damage-inducible protein DinB
MGLLKELTFADVESELAATRRLLARVPKDELDWKPHEKSMSLGKLSSHLVEIVSLQTAILTTDGVDFGSAPPPSAPSDNLALLAEALETNAKSLHDAIEGIDEESLKDDWTLRFGDHVIFTRPRAVVFRSLGQSHLAHHRGQLTVYLRLLGISLPPVYGPTADEQ